jgi:hypothetical protein
MELCNATVRLGGSVGHTVEKVDLTPPEIAVLRRIHGQDAVINIAPVRMDKRGHAVERARLEQLYGDQVVAEMFPGTMAKLPVMLKDIGLGPSPTPQVAPVVLEDVPEPTEDELKALGLDGGDGLGDGEGEKVAA